MLNNFGFLFSLTRNILAEGPLCEIWEEEIPVMAYLGMIYLVSNKSWMARFNLAWVKGKD